MENIASLTKKLGEQAQEIEKLSKTVEELEQKQVGAVSPAINVGPGDIMPVLPDRINQLERILARVMHQTGTATLLKGTTITPFEPSKKDMSKYNV
jgi:uncharacterized membrane protein